MLVWRFSRFESVISKGLSAPPFAFSAKRSEAGAREDHGSSVSNSITEWHEAIQEIATTYSDVDRRSLSVPDFSVTPFGIYFWSSIKFAGFLDLDLLLFVPVNFVILVRNIFPGRWRHWSFSGRYFKVLIQWFRNGEVPIVALVAIRSMSVSLRRSRQD